MSTLQGLPTSTAPRGFVQRHIRLAGRPHARIRREDPAKFLHHLSTLLSAGTPLLEALTIAGSQSQSLKLRHVVRSMTDRVAAGASLHAAAGAFPRCFKRHWIEVIRTGELSGNLAEVLAGLSEHISQGEEIRSKLISAMIYPCILLGVAVLAVVVMLWKVVPVFAEFFKEFGSKLPDITQAVIDASGFLQVYFLHVAAGVAGAFFLARWYLKRESGRRLVDHLSLTMPLVGPCVVGVYMERFAGTMALLLRSGLPLLDSLQAMQGVFHSSRTYREALARVSQQVASGESLAGSLGRTGLFPSLLVSMVHVGEQSGQLPGVFAQAASQYRRAMQATMERLARCIEPLVILGMGVTIAVILASIYLPMFEMASGPR